jgi:hypothetical protein
MAYGLRVWDASGNLRVDTNVQIARWMENGVHTFSVSTTPTAWVSAPAGDGGTLYVIVNGINGTTVAPVVEVDQANSRWRITGNLPADRKVYYWAMRAL